VRNHSEGSKKISPFVLEERGDRNKVSSSKWQGISGYRPMKGGIMSQKNDSRDQNQQHPPTIDD